MKNSSSLHTQTKSPARAQFILPVTKCRVYSLKLKISPEPVKVAHGLTIRYGEKNGKMKNKEEVEVVEEKGKKYI